MMALDAAAQLVPLPSGDLGGLPGAEAQIHAVCPPSGGAVVAGGDDLVILHDDGTVDPAQAGRPLQHGLGNVQIVIFFTDTVHWQPSVFFLMALF